MHGDNITSQNSSRCSKNIGIKNNSIKTRVKSKRSTGSANNRNNCSSTWTTLRSSNFARILQNFNVLIAIPSRKSGSFVAVAGEIWSTCGVPQQPRRRIATPLQSLALSLSKFQSRTKARPIWTTDHVLQGERDAQESKTRTTWQPSDDTFKVVRSKRKKRGHSQSTMLAKKKSCFTIASLLNDMIIQLYTSWTITERQTLGSLFECWWAPETSSTRICRCIICNAWKCKMLFWRRRNKLWYRSVHNINSVNDKISNSKEETSITLSIARLDGGITESHGETRRKHLHLHLQLRSGRLRNGKRVGAHGNLHHLRNGGDFGFLERIAEDRREVKTVHPQHTAHGSAVQSLHMRGTHRTRLAQEFHNIFVLLKRICHLVHTCLTLCCSHLQFTTSTSSSSFAVPPRTPCTSWTSPGSPSGQAAPSRTSLAWKPAGWRIPAQNTLHIFSCQPRSLDFEAWCCPCNVCIIRINSSTVANPLCVTSFPTQNCTKYISLINRPWFTNQSAPQPWCVFMTHRLDPWAKSVVAVVSVNAQHNVQKEGVWTLKELSKLWKLYTKNADWNKGEISSPLVWLRATSAFEVTSLRSAENCPRCPWDSDAQVSSFHGAAVPRWFTTSNSCTTTIKLASRFKFVIVPRNKHVWKTSKTMMISRAGQYNFTGTFVQATQRSKFQETNSDILGIDEPGDFKDRIIFMSVVKRQWKRATKQWTKKLSETRNKIPNMQSNFRQVIGVAVDLDKKERGTYELGQTSQRMGSHRQENDTEGWRSFTSNFEMCWTSLEKSSQAHEGQEDIHFQSTPQTQTIVIRTFFMRSIVHRRRGLSRLIGTVKTKTQSRSRELDPPQRSNGFGKPYAKQHRQQHYCSSFTRCWFLSWSWQRPTLCD